MQASLARLRGENERNERTVASLRRREELLGEAEEMKKKVSHEWVGFVMHESLRQELLGEAEETKKKVSWRGQGLVMIGHLCHSGS